MRPGTDVSKKSGVRADLLDDVPYVEGLAAQVGQEQKLRGATPGKAHVLQLMQARVVASQNYGDLELSCR